MNNYNLVIIENKQCIPYLNLTEQAFYDKLWDQELWDNYSWGLHLEDEEYESQEEEDEAYDQAWEDWACDCEINVEEATEEDLKDIAPGGDIDNIKIVYDERK